MARLVVLSSAAVVELVIGMGATTAQSSPPDPPVVKTRRALDHLGAAAVGWQNSFGCSGCHKQAETIAAIGTGRAGGYEDAKPGVLATLLQGLLTGNSGQGSDGCFSLRGTSSFTFATAIDGRGLEAYDAQFSADHRSNLTAAAGCLLGKQAVDGSVPSDHTELPVAQGDYMTTAHAVFVWDRSFEDTGDSTYSSASVLAVSWLRGQIGVIEASPSGFTTQDKAMLLAGLARSGAGTSDPDVQRMHDLLATDQQPDGSWMLTSTSGGGNAHAAGEAVFALRMAGYTRSDVPTDHGTQWLLDHQQGDGSWTADFWDGNSPSAVAPSMWGTLALATYPSPLNGLRLSGGANATVSWGAVDGASSYDLVRGSISSLAELSDHVDLGAVQCLASATAFTSAGDAAIPPPGESFFYLMRIRWGASLDIYGRSSGGHDEIPSSGDCPP